MPRVATSEGAWGAHLIKLQSAMGGKGAWVSRLWGRRRPDARACAKTGGTPVLLFCDFRATVLGGTRKNALPGSGSSGRTRKVRISFIGAIDALLTFHEPVPHIPPL